MLHRPSTTPLFPPSFNQCEFAFVSKLQTYKASKHTLARRRTTRRQTHTIRGSWEYGKFAAILEGVPRSFTETWSIILFKSNNNEWLETDTYGDSDPTLSLWFVVALPSSAMRGWLTLESTERAKKVCLRLREIAPRPEAGSRNLGQTFWPNPYFFYKRQYVSS